jgi:porin
MKKLLTMMTLFGMMAALNGYAQIEPGKTEVDRLEERIEELEQKQAEAFGALPDIAKKVVIEGVLSGVYQYEGVDGPPGVDDKGRGALSFQPGLGIALTEADELFFLLGFAAGNGLAGVTPFTLAPWAAGVEDDVKDINGRNRDYLLQAWYKHTFAFSEDHTLGLLGGIIDATDYLDDNAYANDEYTQFMNEALVNGPNAFLPSWDIGGAAEWDIGPFGVRGVYMNIGENDDGNNFNFYGVQFNYLLETPLGEGNYRVVLDTTSEAFLDPQGLSEETRQSLLFSFDQALGEIFGAWIRFGFQTDDALIDYERIYSGGIYISGNWWGREQDHIGIGYAHLDGAEQTDESLKSTNVAEAYMSFGLTDYLALTFDLQYMKDKYVDAASDNDVDGWIAGVRATCEF